MNLIVHLRIVGVLLMALVALNTQFPRHFGWREELKSVSLLTRQVFEVHSFFIIFVLTLMGSVTLCFPRALLEQTRLGSLVAGALFLFWSMRLAFQFFVYDSRLWRGHRLNTAIHVIFSGLWAYFVLVFGMLLRMQM